MLRLTLYTRPGCHLCDAMKSVVDAIARNEPVTLRQVDITGNGDLERRFGVEIPVLVHDGEVIARVRTTRAALLKSLRKTDRRRAT
ncbi:MAG: glutaredoxin family protein [Acidobacteria bacterium]|nr:glutaredoxin family protein [Acidobacteriota bacterium]